MSPHTQPLPQITSNALHSGGAARGLFSLFTRLAVMAYKKQLRPRPLSPDPIHTQLALTHTDTATIECKYDHDEMVYLVFIRAWGVHKYFALILDTGESEVRTERSLVTMTMSLCAHSVQPLQFIKDAPQRCTYLSRI